jgi:hypothetical protein
MTSGKPYLTEGSLAAQLKRLVPENEFIHNRTVTGAKVEEPTVAQGSGVIGKRSAELELVSGP